jgi:hypothetical protein
MPPRSWAVNATATPASGRNTTACTSYTHKISGKHRYLQTCEQNECEQQQQGGFNTQQQPDGRVRGATPAKAEADEATAYKAEESDHRADGRPGLTLGH